MEHQTPEIPRPPETVRDIIIDMAHEFALALDKTEDPNPVFDKAEKRIKELYGDKT